MWLYKGVQGLEIKIFPGLTAEWANCALCMLLFYTLLLSGFGFSLQLNTLWDKKHNTLPLEPSLP